MPKKTVKDIKLKGQRVLVRVDFNVPLDKETGEITDDNRIVQALPTIKYIIEQGGKAILFSHLGKIKSEEDKIKNTLAPIARRLSELIKVEVKFVPTTRGVKLEQAINDMNYGDILLLENTRFEDLNGKKESKNDPELGKYWASLGDVFVNDAFGTAHRSHASNVGIASNIDCVSGFLMEKEINFIGGAVSNPKSPFIAILGGAKVSDKIAVIENLLAKADKVLIGGGMNYTFLKAQGYNVGESICELERVDFAKKLLEKGKEKLILPIDIAVSKAFNNDAPFRYTSVTDIKADEMGMDIGPKTIELFTKALIGAKTVVWNGPMGVFEMDNYTRGPIGICKAIAELKDATTIIGGGDSAAAAIQFGYRDKFSHISTGGGASLEYLEGKTLPGVKVIQDCGKHCG